MEIIARLTSFLRGNKVEICIVIGCIGIFIPFILFSKPVRVGDGSEYYALSLAWSTTHKPFMTDGSWEQYSLLVDSGEIIGPTLKDFFPALRLGSSADFNHFWFYSLGAAVISKIGDKIFGISIPVHTTFLLWHCLLLATMLIIAWRCFGWKGLLSAVLLTSLSPIIWYFDKVHTEFFTFCLTTSTVMLFIKRRYLPAAFFLALAATQNISFAALSFLALGFGIVLRGGEKYSLGDVVLITLTIAAAVIHPVYYYSRFGILDPIMFTGGANVGSNLTSAYIWILDPDLGLLPNWPLGIVLLVLSIIIFRGNNYSRRRIYAWLVFVICYTGISLWAQSSTTNLNSGATPGLARYALWYLPLFFPAILLLVDKITLFKWPSILLMGIFVISFIYNFHFNNPNICGCGNNFPSPFSLFIQTSLPKIYNPPPEVFVERYSYMGDAAGILKPVAVVGPDCHKVLYMNPIIPDKKQIILGGKGCGFDLDRLKDILEAKNSLIISQRPKYLYLSDKEYQESIFIPTVSEWISAAQDGKAIAMMNSGWYQPEIWGTWSEGNLSTLNIPCPSVKPSQTGPLILDLEIQPFVAPEHPNVTIKINVGNKQLWSGSLDKIEIVSFALPKDVCTKNNFTMSISIDNPTSPEKLGLSSDSRILGIGLIKMRFRSPADH